MKQQRTPLVKELPLIFWLVVVWGALWRDFSPGNLVFGLIIAVILVNFFYLPPIELSGRFNVYFALRFLLRFLGQLVIASLQVFWLALRHGPHIRNAVVAVGLRSRTDILVTATGHALTLIPGSLVIDVDRSTSTLYLHCLNIRTAEQADAVRADALATEAGLIRMFGSREELELLRNEET